MSAANKKQFRSRRCAQSDEDDDEDEGPAIVRPLAAAGKKKKEKKKLQPAGAAPATSSSAKKGSSTMLSFDDYEEGEGALQPLKTKKKAFSKKPLHKAMEELEKEGNREGSFFPSGNGSSGGGGEYTAEKLAALKKGQNFQLSTKASKATEKKTRVTFMAPDGSSGTINPEDEEEEEDGEGEAGAEEVLDKERVRRLKREKQLRNREAMGPAEGDGSDDHGEEDFIALDGDAQRRAQKEQGRKDRLDKAALPADQDIEDDWESEMIRRGARKGPPSSMGSLNGSGKIGAMSSSLSGRVTMGGAVPFKSVERVLRDVKNTKERVDEAHEKNERAAEKTRSELELAKAGVAKLKHEFQDTAERFQFFQEVRDYISSLCGCLREKEGMVNEMEEAMAQIRRDAKERRVTRRLEDQEDALEELQEQGTLLSLQHYTPSVSKALQAVGDPSVTAAAAEPELDEFGRDKSYAESGIKEKRRRDRLRRRQRVAAAARTGPEQDTAEAEANLSGAEDSDVEVELTGTRQRKLLEAAQVIFEDVAEEFSGIEPVARRFEIWKKTYPKDYQTAYVSAGLPQIFEPFVRVEMAGWNPLGRGQEEEAAAIESFHWYTCLFSYGQDASAPLAEDDPDDRLVPQLIEKVAVDRLEVLLTDFYDPFSSQETNKSIAAIQALLIYEPGKHAMEKLLHAPLERLKRSVKQLCLPLLKPSADAGAVSFQRRQIFKAVKLYSNINQWHEVLAPRVLAPLALGQLLEKTLAPALANRLENYSSSSSSSSSSKTDEKALVEVLGTLEVLVAATSRALLLEKNVPPFKTVYKVLDRIAAHEVGGYGPIASTVSRLKGAFGAEG